MLADMFHRQLSSMMALIFANFVMNFPHLHANQLVVIAQITLQEMNNTPQHSLTATFNIMIHHTDMDTTLMDTTLMDIQ